MKTLLAVFLAAFLAAAPAAGGDTVQKYRFSVYVLASGKMNKPRVLPDFGWRAQKSYPAKIREFTYPSAYLDNSQPLFKETADAILSGIQENRRKNAVAVAAAVFDFINSGIREREVKREVIDSHQRVYYSALQALSEKAGCGLEKCRLATALLRLLVIPARTSMREGRYVVEFYILPLAEKGRPGWFVWEPGEPMPDGNTSRVPVDWHALDSKEMLSESWKDELLLEPAGIKIFYFGAGSANASQDAFTALSESGTEPKDALLPPESGEFYMVRETVYEISLPARTEKTRVEIALPFNITDEFRTLRYFAGTKDGRISVKAKWPQTAVKQSQEGMTYTLPVEINLIDNR